jgi:hypothetical protein
LVGDYVEGRHGVGGVCPPCAPFWGMVKTERHLIMGLFPRYLVCGSRLFLLCSKAWETYFSSENLNRTPDKFLNGKTWLFVGMRALPAARKK